MRKTFQKLLSKSLLAAFIFLFAAGPVFAQTDWTPPTGPATGNNVEPPINTSSFEQTKRGNLNLEGDLILDGSKTPTALDPGPWIFNSEIISSFEDDVTLNGNANPSAVFSNWITSFFGDDVLIGSPLAGGGNQGPFPLLFLNGTLRYSPKAVGTGAIAPLSAEELADGGYENVLIGDAQGNVRWTDSANIAGSGGGGITVEIDPRLPFGTAANQVLTWNGTAWVPGSALPDGTNQNDILVWDTATQTWIVAAYPTGGGTLPPGTQGQTMWYNGTGWQATNRISYTQDIFPPNSHTLHVGDLNTAGTVVVEDSSVSIKGPNVEIGYSNDTGTTNIKGNSLFLDSTNVAITNVSSNPLAGRFLFSKDDNGKVEWNKNLVYARDTLFGDSFYDTVSVLNDPDLVPGQNGYIGTFFVNEGATYLKGNTAIDGETIANEKLTIKDPGDLYLEGVDYPPAIYWEQTVDHQGNPVSNLHANTDKLKQLCIDTETFKVVYCDSPDPKPAPTHEYVTVTCTPTGCDHDITLPYTFEEDLTIDLEYCAGGGGGGGGGKGTDVPEMQLLFGNQYAADGGGGGGGGAGGGGVAGGCNTVNEVNVTNGDVLEASIGAGGNGGSGSYKSDIYNITDALVFTNPALTTMYQVFQALPNEPGPFNSLGTEIVFQDAGGTMTNVSASSGNEGGDTQVSLAGNPYLPVVGGVGGNPGTDASVVNVNNNFSTIQGEGGLGGYSSLQQFNWFNGEDGVGVIGGAGGDGESPDNISNNGATSVSGGRGGGVPTGDSSSSMANGGQTGKLSFGGGGGSGGFGDYWEQFGCGQGSTYSVGDIVFTGLGMPVVAQDDLYNKICRILKGGNGGKGGDGYLKIHNFPIPIVNVLPPTQIVYEAPGTYTTFSWDDIPANASTVTIEVWGGGGGGGNVSTGPGNYPDKFAGGGGAGGYVKHTMPVPSSGTATITVGAAGAAGVSGNNGNGGGNAGTNGGLSKFIGAGVTLQANGGFGGGGNVQNTGTGGNGGTGFTVPNGIAEIAADGEDGEDGSATSPNTTGLGGDAQNTTSFIADGGQGGIFNGPLSPNDSQSRNPTAGKKGTVRITWN